VAVAIFSNRNACGTTTLKPVRNHSSAPRGLVMAFSGCMDGLFSAHVGIEVGCVRSPYEANLEGSPEVETTAQLGFAAYHSCVR
jgi:hypothetical protein